MSVWDTPGKVDDLSAHIDAGLSASEAGRKLRVSKNAAISKARQFGWAFGKPRPAHQPAPEPKPMTALAVVPTEDLDLDPLERLADEMLAEHRVTQYALPAMLGRVMADDDLRTAALEKLIGAECRRTLDARLAFRAQAEKRRTGGGPLGAQRSSNLSGWAGAVAESLMDDFKLPNGRKLGDAVRADLQAALASYQILADDARIKHRWLTFVLQSVPAGKTVREALTDARLKELREEAKNGLPKEPSQ